MMGTLIWGLPQSGWWIAAAALVFAALLLWSYVRAPLTGTGKWVAASAKAIAVILLLVLLAEPLWHGVRPRPGANLFLVLADNSISLQVRDRPDGPTRSQQLQAALGDDVPWLIRLAQDFDVRRYMFDTQLVSVQTFRELDFSGFESAAGRALRQAAQRYMGRPVAGIFVLTDGVATDTLPDEEPSLPPVFPVLVGQVRNIRDVQLREVHASHSNFQSAPVTITATVAAEGLLGRTIVVQVVDEHEKVVQVQTWQVSRAGTQQFTFRFRPHDPADEFFRVQAYLKDELADAGSPVPPRRTEEVTLENNRRTVRPQRDPGPYRVLYVSGRPNWEFKFLRRALERDEEIKLIALIRIAKREAKFEFRGHLDNTNPLFRGFELEDKEQVERYDEPVLLRIGVESADQLRQGFPVDAEELFAYDAVILDDLEASFFTGDQLTLLHRFVSVRGGGLMLLAGSDSFAEGGYARTVLEDLSPVYVPSSLPDDAYGSLDTATYRMELSRDGQLQPWVRLRNTLEEELKRLRELPAFRVRNAVANPKPGAVVLLTVRDAAGNSYPALVTQRFGRGRTAALLVGDLWRWMLQQTEPRQREDFEYYWVQLVRWLVTGGLRRVELDIQKEAAHPLVRCTVRVRDGQFELLENAQVKLVITTPARTTVELTAEPDDQQAGVYHAEFAGRQPGTYKVEVLVTTADGETCDPVRSGWVHEPLVEELRTIEAPREPWERLARRTGGEVLAVNQLDRFVRSLPSRKVPITEPWIYPLWHRWPVLLVILFGLIAEWLIRRTRGLP